MRQPTNTSLLIMGLLRRGYSEATRQAPEFAAYRLFAISPNHARRICGHQRDKVNRLWLSTAGCHLRHGVSWAMGKPIARATIRSIQAEGFELWQHAQAQPARVLTIADIFQEET